MPHHHIVIGGGIIGLSAAAECARRGHRVTVVERGPANRQGCSTGNAGLIVPSHFVPLASPGMVWLGLKWMLNPRSPFYIRPRLDGDLISWAWRFARHCTRAHVERAAPLLRDLNLASREIYVRAADSGMDFGLVKRGLLVLCKTEQHFEEEARSAAKARELGLEADVLDTGQVARAEPDVTMDVAGAVRFPMDCHMQPTRYLAALEQAITSAGGTVMTDTTVTGWRREGNRLAAINTSKGEIAGDEFILCGGAWSQDLVRDLGLRLPIQAGKGYSLTLPNPVQMPATCALLAEARIAVTPMGDCLRFAGTMEIAGLGQEISQARVEGIIDAIPRYFPRFDAARFSGIKPWCGLRPCSPDGLPYLGRTRAASNLIVATGHAMMGVSLAPITGEIVGKLLDGEPVPFDIAFLSPDRYA